MLSEYKIYHLNLAQTPSDHPKDQQENLFLCHEQQKKFSLKTLKT